MKANKQIWITHNNGKEKLQLPINPESYVKSNGSSNEVVSIAGLGEVNIIRDPALFTFSFTAEFPAFASSRTEYRDIPKPRDAMARIEKWIASGKPSRLIITNTPWNWAVTIEDFSYEESGGDVDTLMATFVFSEYRFITVRKMTTKTDKKTGEKTAAVKKTTARPSTKTTPTTYTVLKGDSLSRIGIKVGIDWRVIAKLNNIKTPYVIQVGKVLKLK